MQTHDGQMVIVRSNKAVALRGCLLPGISDCRSPAKRYLKPWARTEGEGLRGCGADDLKKRDAVAMSGDVLSKGDPAALPKGDRPDVPRFKSANPPLIPI
jgi:hypothetical protein